TIDLPNKDSLEVRQEQLQDPEVKKVISALEEGSPEESCPWAHRGYLMNQGVLYRYTQDGDEEEAQLVVPSHKQAEVLQQYHDAPTAGHYGIEHTLPKIRTKYFLPGMRASVAKYIKECAQCQRYKATNLKPAGLLQTPAIQQRFEVLAVDLFGSLPPGPQQERWVLIIEDYATRWIELFALESATADQCAWTLVYEVFLRYGFPRRLISDNGSQFISSIMQQITYCLDIDHRFTPVYHPSGNPVERRNRELKTQLSILLGQDHAQWPSKLSSIRFAMNTTRCPMELQYDLRQVVVNDNFIPEVTPRLLRMVDTMLVVRDTHEREQDRRKEYADSHRRPGNAYAPGDKVWVATHGHSSTRRGQTSKFYPKRDGPYIILSATGPNSYQIADPAKPTKAIGTYHTSALTPVVESSKEPPVAPIRALRKRGRPRKTTQTRDQST
ncbi:hypothetical protein NQ315_012582, partial [Exocentrus adspersus]